MRVVKCTVEDGALKAVITIGGTYAEVDGPEALKLALTTATQNGVPKAGLNTQSGVYPVGADGRTSEELISGKTPVAEYRQDFTCAGI